MQQRSMNTLPVTLLDMDPEQVPICCNCKATVSLQSGSVRTGTVVQQ